MQPATYIMASRKDGVVYTGVTAYLVHRTYQHKNPTKKCFSSQYHCSHLVYYEFYASMDEAIAREKQIKGGSRKKKVDLIEKMNPQWRDLYRDII